MRQVVNGTELPREQPSRLGVLLVLILLTAATLTADEGFFWVALGLLLASAALCFRLMSAVRSEARRHDRGGRIPDRLDHPDVLSAGGGRSGPHVLRAQRLEPF